MKDNYVKRWILAAVLDRGTAKRWVLGVKVILGIAILTAVMFVFFFVPLVTCPNCHQKESFHMRTSMGCPICGSRGKITVFESLLVDK